MMSQNDQLQEVTLEFVDGDIRVYPADAVFISESYVVMDYDNSIRRCVPLDKLKIWWTRNK